MKKARAESDTLKRELRGLLKAPGSVLSTILKKSVRRKDQLLPFYLHIRNCLQALQPFPIREGTFDVISTGQIKTLDGSFCAIKKGKHFRHFNALFVASVLNNVLLKNIWIPKLALMGTITLKSNPETYIL